MFVRLTFLCRLDKKAEYPYFLVMHIAGGGGGRKLLDAVRLF